MLYGVPHSPKSQLNTVLHIFQESFAAQLAGFSSEITHQLLEVDHFQVNRRYLKETCTSELNSLFFICMTYLNVKKRNGLHSFLFRGPPTHLNSLLHVFWLKPGFGCKSRGSWTPLVVPLACIVFEPNFAQLKIILDISKPHNIIPPPFLFVSYRISPKPHFINY